MPQNRNDYWCYLNFDLHVVYTKFCIFCLFVCVVCAVEYKVFLMSAQLLCLSPSKQISCPAEADPGLICWVRTYHPSSKFLYITFELIP